MMTAFRFRAGFIVLLLATVALSSAVACGSDEPEGGSGVLPTPTPGTLPATTIPQARISAGDEITVEIFVGAQGLTQQGTAELSRSGEGSRVKLSVRPAPGAIQLVSLREGRCDDIGRWLESLEHAVGGESLTVLPDYSMQSLLDGNHIVSVSFPDSNLSDISSCGEFPELDLEETLQQ